ncbi:hypothetical protein M426DRAFT_20430 [Hypoxylon sp. CI-4A]|nr:hypothetical protein M426DRAFT_20430 [Hypoxylon sp. CI-4A]
MTAKFSNGRIRNTGYDGIESFNTKPSRSKNLEIVERVGPAQRVSYRYIQIARPGQPAIKSATGKNFAFENAAWTAKTGGFSRFFVPNLIAVWITSSVAYLVENY